MLHTLDALLVVISVSVVYGALWAIVDRGIDAIVRLFHRAVREDEQFVATRRQAAIRSIAEWKRGA